MKQIITFIFILATALSVHSSLWEKAGGFMGNLQGINETKIVVRPKAPQSLDESLEATYRDITLTAAGTLAEALGEDANLVDSLVVRGPINEADFKTMWSASFHGKLEVIDLENAEIENDIVPECAFWDAKAQFNKYVRLRKIALPDGITEIGGAAFYNAMYLEEIKLPSSLVKIGDSAFYFCVRLHNLKFPESLEVIEDYAFTACLNFSGEVVLPEGLKSIGWQAFYNCAITGINFPSTLEYLGGWSFAGNMLVEISIPDNCMLASNGCQFLGNHQLKKARLPLNATIIPFAFFQGCWVLEEVDFPTGLVTIEESAFERCMSLQSVSLPESLESIEGTAFINCSALEEIVLPASLKTIGDRAFADTGLKKIYSKAVTAPMCTPTTFQGVPNTTPLYIPVGSRNDYVSTQNYWYNFINIIETDDFPSLSVSDIDVDGGDEADAPVYDLMGRRVDSPQPGQIYIRAGKKFTVKP